MNMPELLRQTQKHLFAKRRLQSLFGESFLQHALFELLQPNYGDDLKYEFRYDGESHERRNEIDIVVPWKLAIEVKWLVRRANGRKNSRHADALARILADICRLAAVHLSERNPQRSSDCWLILGGLRTVFWDFFDPCSVKGAINPTDFLRESFGELWIDLRSLFTKITKHYPSMLRHRATITCRNDTLGLR